MCERNRPVFATRKGTPLDAQNVVNRHFKPLLKCAGLPDIRWHDLRHTYATLLLARGTHKSSNGPPSRWPTTGPQTPPATTQGLRYFRVSSLSKPIVENRRADSSR
jgi:integrase